MKLKGTTTRAGNGWVDVDATPDVIYVTVIARFVQFDPEGPLDDASGTLPFTVDGNRLYAEAKDGYTLEVLRVEKKKEVEIKIVVKRHGAIKLVAEYTFEK